jgi:hypothetical protein
MTVSAHFIREAVGEQEEQFFAEMEILILDTFRNRVLSANFEYTAEERNYVTIYVLEGDESIKQEVSDLLANRYEITFFHTQYTLSQKIEAYNAIVNSNDNIILSVEHTLGSLTVEVIVQSEYHDDYSEKLTKMYGEFINVHPFYIPQILSNGIPGRGTIENPEKYWDTNGYPDNISFAFEGGGALENGLVYHFWIIGIISADKNDKQAILDLFSPQVIITFDDTIYPYNERKTVYNEILAMNDENILKIYLMRNVDNVLVFVSDVNLDTYTELFDKKYGSIVRVTDESLDIETGNNIDYTFNNIDNLNLPGILEIDTPESTNFTYLWSITIIIALLCGMLAILHIIRNNHNFIKQANTGSLVIEGNVAPISEKQIVVAIKECVKTPSDNVYRAILEQVNKK